MENIQLIRTEQKFIRTSPRKIGLVVAAIKNLTPTDAIEHLSFLNKRAAGLVAKVIKQAIANAENNFHLKREDLEFKQILVKKAPTLKRGRPVSRGRMHPILKRSCHLEVILKSKKLTSPVTGQKLNKPTKKNLLKKLTGVKTTKSKKANKNIMERKR